MLRDFAIARAVSFFGLRAGLTSLREWSIDVDLLMILAALGAALVGNPFEGALLLVLFSISNVLQNYALSRTRTSIEALIALRPDEALVRRDGELQELAIEQILLHDRVLVRPGERIPLDGVILEGQSAVDQSSMTGESIPVSRAEGDVVLAGTINQTGSLEIEVTALAENTTLAKMIRLVEEAQLRKAKTERFVEVFEQRYAVLVIVATILLILIPYFFLNEAFDSVFYRAMTVLVAASPCALVISTPASVLSAIANGARHGILFKGGAYVEQAAEIRVVAFDKTGTLTTGLPQVLDVVPMATTKEELMSLAAAVESRSEHPLAEAIVAAAEKMGVPQLEATEVTTTTGKGIAATVNGRKIGVGSPRFFASGGIDGTVDFEVDALQAEGKTTVVVGEWHGGRVTVLGLIALADTIRPDAASAIQKLRDAGVEKIIMLTGDHEQVAHAIAEQAGVDRYYGGLLPEDKLRIIEELQQEFGTVAMVGDGVNDSPALAAAQVGVAMGAAGTDVALESADVVLMANDLGKLAYAIALSRRTRRTLLINLGFAMGMIVLMLIGIFAIQLPLPLAVIGHEGGTVLVSLNGLRLLASKPE